MKAIRLKFKNLDEIDDVSLIDYNKINNIIDTVMETEVVNNVVFYKLNEEEFIIAGENLDEIFKAIFRLFDDFKEVQLLISEFTKHLKNNIDSKELTIKLFPSLYMKYLKNKKKFFY